jgi:hypothetical protein
MYTLACFISDTYKFQSRLVNCTELHDHIQKCLGHAVTRETESTKLHGHMPKNIQRYTFQPTSKQSKPSENSIYLQPIDVRSLIRHNDDPLYMNSSVCQKCIDCCSAYYAEIDDSRLRPYSLDLNEYVQNNDQLRRFILE